MTITIIPVTWFKKIGDKIFPKSIRKIFGINEISTEYITSDSVNTDILKTDNSLLYANGLFVYSDYREFIDLEAGDKKWRGITSQNGVLYACVYNGSIWKSNDKGNSWTDLETGNKQWLGITSQNGVLYACVNEGSIWKSEDDGSTWTDLVTGNKDWIFISSSDNYLFAIDFLGVLYRSSDGFVSFEKITTGFMDDIRTIRQVNNYLLAGNGKKIMKSTDDGITWEEFSTIPSTVSIQDIISNKYNGIIFAYDQNYNVYYSRDGGITWAQKDLGYATIKKYYGASDDEYAYMCASQSGVGTILRAKMCNDVGNDNGSTQYYGTNEIAEESDECPFENGLYVSQENGRLSFNQDGSIFDVSVPRATASHDGQLLGVSGSIYAFVTAFSNIKVEADDESSFSIGDSDTLYILGGTGIETEKNTEIAGVKIKLDNSYLNGRLSKFIGINEVTASSYAITATCFGKLIILNNANGVLVDMTEPDDISYTGGEVVSFLDISTIASELTCATGISIISRDNAYTSAGSGAFFSAIAIDKYTWALSGDLVS
jgi:photosystem II stability/assembly factor-like uncharacterized protein